MYTFSQVSAILNNSDLLNLNCDNSYQLHFISVKSDRSVRFPHRENPRLSFQRRITREYRLKMTIIDYVKKNL